MIANIPKVQGVQCIPLVQEVLSEPSRDSNISKSMIMEAIGYTNDDPSFKYRATKGLCLPSHMCIHMLHLGPHRFSKKATIPGNVKVSRLD